nr:ATP-binding cassette domain-containing protein [uncultured Actinoplanes sp.]
MIEVEALTKRYGNRTVVDDLSFTVRPGTVTGFLGPNGAGKSTTMRMILGLDRPTSGRALVGGKPFAAHPDGLRHVGALLDAGEVQAQRRAAAHLEAAAATIGLGRARVGEVLRLVGLDEVGRQRISGFSLGMRQRLGIALALLGDPPVVMLDEPINGLDPDGVVWIRHLLRSLAAEGRTVFVSSHLMSEVAQTADHLIVIGRGRLVADVPTADLLHAGAPAVTVRADEAGVLGGLLEAGGARVERQARELLQVRGLSAHDVARIALDHHVLVHELTQRSRSLEEAFMDLTHDSVEFQGSDQR